MAYVDKINKSGTSYNIQDARLSSQTAYSSKGSATKVPQITTNSMGQVTSITEVAISGASSVEFDLPAFSDTTTVTGITGVTASTVGIFGLSSEATADEYAAAAEAQLQLIGQNAGSVTIRANAGSLSTAIPCVINIFG